MCREIHLADIRTALIDSCDDDDVNDELEVDDLLAEFEAAARKHR